MSRPIEQALAGLIPTLSGPLPADLISLSTSLLAQSRSKASTLKQDEEIARTHACAHLACERLKQRLNLPQIQPRPPCPPRIYNKVYKYFDSALAAKPASRQGEKSDWTREESAPETPSKRRVASAKSTPSKRTPVKRGYEQDDEQLDRFMPVIRRLCDAFAVQKLIPHICAGTLSVLRLHQRPNGEQSAGKRKRGRPRKEDSVLPIGDAQLPAVIVVVLFHAWMRMSGVRISEEKHLRRRRKAAKSIVEYLPQDPARVKDEAIDEVENDIEVFMQEAEKGWLDMEWYENIEIDALDPDESPQLNDTAESDFEQPVSRRSKRDEVRSIDGSGSLQCGLGTMMQPALDFLSEGRRRDYVHWKAKMMKRIKEMEREDVTAEAQSVPLDPL